MFGGKASHNPVGDEAADAVEHLPAGHDVATDLRGRNLADVDGAGGESHALSETNDDTTGDEDSDLVVRGEGLHKGRDDGDEAADGHAPAATEVVGLQTDER